MSKEGDRADVNGEPCVRCLTTKVIRHSGRPCAMCPENDTRKIDDVTGHYSCSESCDYEYVWVRLTDFVALRMEDKL